jgi:microcystin-dependent protein
MRHIVLDGVHVPFGSIPEGKFLKRQGGQIVGADAGGGSFSGSYNDLTDKPSSFTPEAHTHDYAASDHNHDAAYATADHTHPGGSEAFPVGSVFIAVVSTNPGTLLGYGTWSAFAAGRMLVGFNAGDTDFDTVEETGGAKTVTLTAAQSGLPQHTHLQNAHTHVQDAHSHTIPVGATDDTSAPFDRADAGTNTGGANATTATGTTPAVNQNATAVNQNAGPSDAAQAHNNMPPYITVYMWKRTA